MERIIIVLFGLTCAVNAKSIDPLGNVHAPGWHIHVTMHVFSGLADPTWRIHSNHPDYNSILQNMASTVSNPIPNRLGYRGFSLVHIPPGKSVNTGGHYNQTVTSHPDWELLLLATSSDLDEDLKHHAKEAIYKRPIASRERRSLTSNDYPGLEDDYRSLYRYRTTVDPIDLLSNQDMYKLSKLMGLDKKLLNITVTPTPPGPTKYEPQKWNKYFVKGHNNCYNYANNRITDTFAQPGRAGKCSFPAMTAAGRDIEKSAKCDGLTVVPAVSNTKLPAHADNLVALVFWPPKPGSKVYDFHWYRLDGNGRWSHKPGHTDATNVDSSERPITDPRHADRGPYTQFVAFMTTRQDKVLLI